MAGGLQTWREASLVTPTSSPSPWLSRVSLNLYSARVFRNCHQANGSRKLWPDRELKVVAGEPQANLMLARYYSAGLSRFLSVDPGKDTELENPQSWNKYAYTRNNPLRWKDPTGKKIEGKYGNDIADSALKNPKRSEKEKKVIKDAKESDAGFGVQKSTQAKAKGETAGGGSVEMTGSPEKVGSAVQKENEKGGNVKPVAGENDTNVSAAGKTVDSQITVFEGTFGIQSTDATLGEFQQKTLIHELFEAGAGGEGKPRSHDETTKELGY